MIMLKSFALGLGVLCLKVFTVTPEENWQSTPQAHSLQGN